MSRALEAAGLAAPLEVTRNYDASGALGGPILRDRIWFFAAVRTQGHSQFQNMYYNKNAGDLSKWTYEASDRQAKSDSNGPIQPNLRLTMQLSRRDRLGLFWDEQISSNSVNQGSSTSAPETGGWNHGWQRVQQVKYTSPATNKLLLEAGKKLWPPFTRVLERQLARIRWFGVVFGAYSVWGTFNAAGGASEPPPLLFTSALAVLAGRWQVQMTTVMPARTGLSGRRHGVKHGTATDEPTVKPTQLLPGAPQRALHVGRKQTENPVNRRINRQMKTADSIHRIAGFRQ